MHWCIPVPVFTNIAAYKFAALSDLAPLREKLLVQCKEWGLKGTILLSPEGLNLFVAGPAAEIGRLMEEVHAIPGLEDLAPKYSESAEQPFTRMLVRVKKEIIAFGVEGIRPGERTSPKLAPATLKQWLDEGRRITLLDTRNDYEVKLGTFQGARALGIDHFRDFPEASRALPEELKDEPVVMFCTGGIRCEKAGPYLEREGFRKVFQLDGGILKYFEECGAAHYDGECFVFDQRVGVDPSLQETGSAQCFVCQTPLDEAEQRDPRFLPDVSCPYCFQTPEEALAERVSLRQAAIDRIAMPLPGSEPYVNLRPFDVPAALDGRSLREILNALFPDTSRAGDFVNAAGMAIADDEILHGGQRCFHRQLIAAEPEVNAAIRVLYEDEALLVLNKPAPLPMGPGGGFQRNTLQFILNQAYAPTKPRPAHRLEANVTGVVVCARTRHFARLLHAQFAQGEVEQVCLSRAGKISVRGRPGESATLPLNVPPLSLHVWRITLPHPQTNLPVTFEAPPPEWAIN